MGNTRQEAEVLTGLPLYNQSRVARFERSGHARVFTVLGWIWTCLHGLPGGTKIRALAEEALQRSLALAPSMSWIHGLEARSGW